jgi:DNA-binding beta-propeller fold protein YncE
MDVAFGADGAVYVLSHSSEVNPSSRVSKVSLGDRSGEEEFILQFGGHGSGTGEFLRTTSLALDKDENVYVADEYLNRISIFDKLGNYLGNWGTPGSGEGEINRPWGLTFDKEDNLWMVDSGNGRVQVFTKEGKFLSTWGNEGSGEGELDMPWGIDIDGQGDVYVADWRNHRVQKFNPDGKYLMSFGAPGSGEGELLHPSGVAIDEEGDVYAVDWAGSQVHAYGPDGSRLTTFMGGCPGAVLVGAVDAGRRPGERQGTQQSRYPGARVEVLLSNGGGNRRQAKDHRGRSATQPPSCLH